MIRRFLRRLVGGEGFEDLRDDVQKVAAAQRRQATSLDERLRALNELIEQRATAKDANEILHAIRALTISMQQPAGAQEEGRSQPEAQLYRALDALARGNAPIVVGPWTGEVGFELLYWIPFVEWFRSRWKVAADRFVVVSRGGVDSWYGMPGARYVDIFSLMPPASFRERNDGDKQRKVDELDRELLALASQKCGLDSPVNLHPELMYRTLGRFWKDETGFGFIDRFMTHRQLQPVDDPIVARLPQDYVAVRFYFSNCFPDKPGNREVARAVIGALAQRTDVVVLNPGVQADDHADFVPDPNGRVMNIANGATPERNLAVQSAVIGRAKAFVGTYGGYSYLAPFYGVPAIGLYSQPSFKLHHLHVAQRVLERLGPASVTAINVVHAHLVHAATAGALAANERAAGAHI